MRKVSIPLVVLASAICVQADFNPVALTPESYNADVVVEKTAPVPYAVGSNATMDGGTNNTGNTWYERGYNTGSPATGLPEAGTTFTHESDPTKQYRMPASYTLNNALLINSQITSGAIALTTPASYTNLSFLSSAGGGAATINYVVRHEDGSTETGSIVVADWFNVAGQAFTAAGRVALDSGTTFNNVGTANPRLHAQNIAVSDVSPVTSVEFTYVSGGRMALFAISGNAFGDTWSPVEISGFNKDMVLAASDVASGALTTLTTVSMDGGTANTGNTWMERGYVPLWPNSGLPPAGSIITSAAQPDHKYLLAPSYEAPNAIYVDASRPTATITIAEPGNYSALSFLNATANGAVTVQAIMQYEDGSSETNTFVAKDWFNGTPFAFNASGRVNLNNRSINNFANGTNPRLYEAEFFLGNTVSRVSSVVLTWLSGAANSRVVILAVSASAGSVKPIFVSQPASVNVFEGTNVAFRATVGGTAPITYQWQKGTNGVFVDLADGGSIVGATSTNLEINGVTLADAADYQLIASNPVGAVTSLVSTVTVISSLPDITSPTDTIAAFGGSTPANEGVEHAVDNFTQKYLNFGSGPNPNATPFVGPVGFVVTPASGITVVKGVRIYTANDGVERDPADVVLEGSRDGGATYSLIYSNALNLPAGRNAGGNVDVSPLTQALQQLMFDNAEGYSTYRVTFNTVKNGPAANSMQIGEIELLGSAAAVLTISSAGPTTLLIGSSLGGMIQSTAELKGAETIWTDEAPVAAADFEFIEIIPGQNRFFRLVQ